jgi:hypothetical protein
MLQFSNYVMNYVQEFKVFKSVHHRTIQINHQPDATIFQFLILTFIYSSACFGRFPAHHQVRIHLYLQHLVFVTPLMLSAAIVEELEPV